MQWVEDRKKLKADADKITDWLVKPPPIASADDANKAIDAILALITNYAAVSKFSNKAKAAARHQKLEPGRFKVHSATVSASDVSRRAIRVHPLENLRDRVVNAGRAHWLTLSVPHFSTYGGKGAAP